MSLDDTLRDALDHLLPSGMAAVEAERVGADLGFAGEVYRVCLDDGSQRALKRSSGNDGRAELDFYRHFASRMGADVPHFFAGHRDGDVTWVLLEFVGGLPGDVLRGSTKEQALALARTLGRIHRRTPEDPPTWLSTWEARLDHRLTRVRGAKAAFVEGYGGVLTTKARRVVETLEEALPGWAATLEAAPHALAHTDFHLDNMIFAARGPVVCDWQTVRWAPQAFDWSRLLLECVHPEARRLWMDALIRVYHEAVGTTPCAATDPESVRAAVGWSLACVMPSRFLYAPGRSSRVEAAARNTVVGIAEMVDDWL